MGDEMWTLRERHKEFDPGLVYGNNPDLFTVEFHHGGEFSTFPDITYERGKVDFVDKVNSELFSVIIMNEMILSLGYSKKDVMKYHFKIPGEDLDFGLRPLSNDSDVISLLKYSQNHKDEDSDFIVDEDKLVQDFSVDMDEFRSVVDFDISEEGEEIINDEDEVDLDDFDSLSESENDTTLQKAVRSIRKNKKKAKESMDCPFYVGQAFSDRDSIKSLVKKFAIESRRQFRRIYICLHALKEGFKICRRELLGLDGCFMKGPFPGQILTAVGVDANNGIYPVAYALVESETFSSWSWFLECLGEDLDLAFNSNFTFISDRQKGIIPAIAKVFPSAEHRYCLRHIHENMKQKWRGQKFKNMLWSCASATTTQWFDKCMKAVLTEDKDLHDWLKEIPPRHWSRSHFCGRSKCDVLLNNLCEVFNRQLVDGRDKPIITCLEFIREYLMKRIVLVHKMISKCQGPLTPTATKIFEKVKSDASEYTVIWCGVSKYQVSGPAQDQKTVDVDQRTCSCMKWELTGMPCRHAVACIWNMATHGLDDGIVEKWVDPCYWLETWKKVYAHIINPINGRDLWTPSSCPTTLTAPKHHKQVGRPKKKRKKSAEEVRELSQTISTSGKMSRKGNTVTCDKCKKKGHNSRTCKGQEERTQH
ncbi:hypothetical protein L1987_75096 [Smallanthus sonchifolius]|uniref:Uncharacterized protein n=1 Tax=Smallanthus sonchifolius TaxID=185202 RepID=A0ACB9A404_9ASTR|nr:hypothetical protein L1987_75096 [Smallanthus sonchifolius]